MDHGSRLKTRSQTPSRTPAKVLPSKKINSSSKSQNPTMSSSSSSSMLTPVQKESVRSVSAGPRERPVNTPLVALLPSGVLTAQKGGRSKTPNRLQASSMSSSASVSSLKKLCSTATPTPAAQAPGSTQALSSSRKLRISGYGRNPCLVKASCIVPEGQLLPRVSPPTFSAKKRCGWITSQSDEAYIAYHDEEWGVPVHDDKLLFELLVLEGAQAEMSRPRILSLRENFRARFEDFDPAVVAKYDEEKIAALKSDSSICIPESKVRGAVENAKRILEVVDEYGSFSSFLWGFVNNKPTVSHYKLQKQVPVKTPKSEALSKELVQRGFQFVGPTVMCSVMQAAGLVNDHLVCCFRHQECSDLAGIKDSRKGSDTQTQMYRQHSSQSVNNRPSQDPTSWVDACNFPYLPGFPSPFELTPSFSLARLPIIDETWERETNTDEEEHGFI
ncbi:unnamed protein product [Sphagnum troendelagicum]